VLQLIVRTSVVLALVIAGSLAGQRDSSAATCVGSVGPGIAPPAHVPAGVPGFHARWYGQSGYMTLCAGEQSTATVAYYNSGSLGWVAGRAGETAYLGTWSPEPGQDRPSKLGGDGHLGTPNTGWPRTDRIAVQPVPYVAPGQVAWFRFMIQAPATPGHYRLYLRPLIEGAAWMEDEGVFWQVVVQNADGTVPPPPAPVPTVTTTTVLASWYGPGFYGNRTACGQLMTTTLQGVAHRTLPCGTIVRLSYGARSVAVPVVDRGPFIAGREFDLTYATKIVLGCTDLCPVVWTR
jgi:hypothetical protein